MRKRINHRGVGIPQIVVQYLSDIPSTYPSLWSKQDLYNTK